MKILLPLFAILLAFVACNNPSVDETDTANRGKAPVEKQSFFPVTKYFKGQLYEIKEIGINPLKITTTNGHMDSVWLKIEELDDAFKEFLYPQIDTNNLISLFTETRFADQTIDAYTLTYDPTVQLPDTLTLRHWDVYIDPATNTVKRIYLVKTVSRYEMMQLTWQSNKWCKITSIITDQSGVSSVSKEEKIIWQFN